MVIEMDIQMDRFKILLPIEGGEGWQFYVESGQVVSIPSKDIYDRFEVRLKEISLLNGMENESYVIEKYSVELEVGRI